VLDLVIRDAQIVDGTGAPAHHGDVGVSGGRIVAVGEVDDGAGRPVPSRSASREELLALATGVGRHPGTTLEAIIPGCLSGFTDDEIALLTDMSLAAGRPLNWNLLAVSSANPAGCQGQLRASEVAAERGGRVVALTLPHAMKIRLSFLSGFVLDGLPGWRDTMHLPVDERLRALAGPQLRRRLNDGAQSEKAGILRGLAQWDRLIIVETFAPENADATGRSVGEVADTVAASRSTRCSTSRSPMSCAPACRRRRSATMPPTGGCGHTSGAARTR
jgi:N-acyl-D-aspartate/D-glutamate deacylase